MTWIPLSAPSQQLATIYNSSSREEIHCLLQAWGKDSIIKVNKRKIKMKQNGKHGGRARGKDRERRGEG